MQAESTGPPRSTARVKASRSIGGDSAARVIFALCAATLVAGIIAIFGFIATKGLSTFFHDGISPLEFFFQSRWKPQSTTPGYGALPIVIGSLAVTGLAIVISGPLSVMAALFMTEVGPPRTRNLLQPVIEVFVGIPSVVYGWIGLKTLVPFIRGHVGGLGFSLLAGGLVLSVMVLPTVTAVAADALRRLPVSLKEASLGLGATRWQAIYQVLVPSAMPGILTGIVLGMARAIGEALAVQMVIGNTTRIPTSLTDTVSTLTSVITLNMGNTSQGTPWNDTLWTMALILAAIALVLILLIRRLGNREVVR